jgi:hypothetical protein
MTRNLALASLALALAACAVPRAPERSAQEWRAEARGKAPWELCHRQIVGGYSDVYGQAVADEIRSQGIDCRDHMAMVQARMQADAAAQQRAQQQTEIALKLLQGSGPRAGNPGGGKCFFEREWTSGFNKNCVYSCTGSEAVQTVSSTTLCPLSITR